MKNTNPTYLKPILDFVNQLDSPNFCEVIYEGDVASTIVKSSSVTHMSNAKLQEVL